jgi:hypothetical protein
LLRVLRLTGEGGAGSKKTLGPYSHKERKTEKRTTTKRRKARRAAASPGLSTKSAGFRRSADVGVSLGP